MSVTHDPAERARLLTLATRASVVTAVMLIIFKLVAWLSTNSVAVLASLVDSFMDAAASLINLLAVHYALQPADENHRFGHGKAESLAGLGQATFIAGSAVFLALQAVDRLLSPRPLQDLALGLGVMGFSIVATAGLLLLQRYVIRRTESTAIKADSLHYATDLATNLSIIAALILSYFGFPGADALFALVLAAYILYSAWEIGRESVDLLMDRELSDEIKHEIYRIVKAQPGVLGSHDLRTRQSGHAYFIQLHLELDATLPLVDAHEISERAAAALSAAYPNAEVIIHEDPVDAAGKSMRKSH